MYVAYTYSNKIFQFKGCCCDERTDGMNQKRIQFFHDDDTEYRQFLNDKKLSWGCPVRFAESIAIIVVGIRSTVFVFYVR